MKKKLHMLHSGNCELKNLISSVRIDLEEGKCELRKLSMESRILGTETLFSYTRSDTDRVPHWIEKFASTGIGRGRYKMNIEKKFTWFAE